MTKESCTNSRVLEHMKTEWKTLSELSTDGKGHYGIPASAVPYSKELYTYLRITDISDNGTLNKEGLKSVKDKKAKDYLLQPNDIVFARSGSIGRNYFYDTRDGELVFAGFLIKFSIDPGKINPKYVKYYCLSRGYKDWISQVDTGSTRGNINAKTFGSMPVPVVPRPQQDALATILSSLDDKIELNDRINANLEEQARAIFKSWFVDFEPFGGKMPEGWREYRLSEFLPVITGKKNANVSSAKGEYPFFSCAQDIAWTDDYSFDGSAILVAGNGDFNVKWYSGKFEAYQRTYVLIPYNPRFTSWLYYAVKHSLSDITSAARGSVINFITKGNLENFSFVAPRNLDSFEIIDTFTSINKLIETRTRENLRLSSLRDALIPRLLSGELDVSKLTGGAGV